MKKISRKDNSLKEKIKEENEKLSLKIRSSSFDPSQITQCRRRIAYRAMGAEKVCDNSYFNKCHHKAIADKWIRYFKACNKTNVFEEHAIVADAEYNLKGTVDILIRYEEIIHAVNIRAVDADKYDQILEKGCLRKDVVDLIACMWMAEVPFGILVYENNNNQEFEIFEVSKNELVVQQIISKCKELIPYQLKGNLPNRDYKSSDSKECMGCEYKEICFKQ